ncbi:MAG: LuxR C-terminal-related transcriptional regulator [Solirubrobacterales bacterium]
MEDTAEQTAQLDRGREAHARGDWRRAFEALESADSARSLSAPDLELLATSAYMTGREGEYRALLERAYRAHLESGELARATRCATSIGISLALLAELGQAGGWVTRAERLLERQGGDQVERGYLLIAQEFELEVSGELERAAETMAEAAALGERFGDQDLVSLASFVQGSVLIGLGRVREGLALLDLAMVAVLAGDVSPISAGTVYCGVIIACKEAHELRRAREWTTAFTRWLETQPEAVAFTGRCLIHRAQLMRLDGSWERAIEEARIAADRCLQSENAAAAGEANYQRAEVHRLRAELEAAEQAYREASTQGYEPQPGLALLRLDQGNDEAAEAAIRRVASEAAGRGRRASLLPAFVEIMVVRGDLPAAEGGCAELESIAAAEDDPGSLTALAAQARGLVELGAGRPREALPPLRRAEQLWRLFEAPYEHARVRELIGRACRALGDEDSANLELEAARETFARLGAATDLARTAVADRAGDALDSHALTERELEVLRLLSTGETNKGIATCLVLSVRTVDRHVSNIYSKLGVSSRAAATTYAHEHGLV